jgi:NAD(P)-dependent dehydrogenase (short-subunit alcohol dehydrogenase family)
VDKTSIGDKVRPQSRSALKSSDTLPSDCMCSTPAEEVAASVAFLASDDAANIHGAILSVDGGLGSDLTHGLDFVA